MLSGMDTAASPRPDSSRRKGAVVVRDRQSCLPLSRTITGGGLVILLTPVVPPAGPRSAFVKSAVTSDPFEPLGRALARQHPWIRHVPYTARGGITSTHVGFIRRAAAVVFVISGPPAEGQTSQVELSEIARSVGENRPHIIVACCDVEELGLLEADFPTIIQLSDYSPNELESAADVLLGKTWPSTSVGPRLQSLMVAPKQWPVELWRAESNPVDKVHELWLECMPSKFHLSRIALRVVLLKDGYAQHYVVREPETREILGFCATYTTFVGPGDELIGSLAVILVRQPYRLRGVGLSLHDFALQRIRRINGVRRLQLGSTFPRLLYGLPAEGASDEWFRRRGWRMDQQEPGSGQEVSDWLLRISDWSPRPFSANRGLVFHRCESMEEFRQTVAMVDRESARNDDVGFHDQYGKLSETEAIRDIVVGVENGAVIATALTFVQIKNKGTLAYADIADEIPWPATIGDDVGGVACICITADPLSPYKRKFLMVMLLDACIKVLSEQGKQRVFLDAVRKEDECIRSLGFQKWASYKEVWRKA